MDILQPNVNEYLVAAEKAVQLRQLSKRKSYGQRHGVDPGIEPVMLSPTRIGQVDTCTFSYLLSKVLGVRPIQTKAALAFGGAVDDGFSALLKSGFQHEDGLRAFRASWAKKKTDGIEYPTPSAFAWTPGDFDVAGERMMLNLCEACGDLQPVAGTVQHWLPHTPIVDPISGAKLSGFVLGGKLDFADLVTEKTGRERVALTDLKTVGSATPAADELVHTRLSVQLTIYAYCAKSDPELEALPGIGELVSYLEAVKQKPRKDGKPNEGKAVQRLQADLAPSAFVELFYLARAAAQKILDAEQARQDGADFWQAYPRNFGSCMGQYGPCDFLKLCRPELFVEPIAVEQHYTTDRPNY